MWLSMLYRKSIIEQCILSVVKSCFECGQVTRRNATKETWAQINQPIKDLECRYADLLCWICNIFGIHCFCTLASSSKIFSLKKLVLSFNPWFSVYSPWISVLSPWFSVLSPWFWVLSPSISALSLSTSVLNSSIWELNLLF